ncbi:hypothetical protein, conserved [Leishmania donovani]|uniref:WD domain, G-beta repeat family protein n=1 Tax=Leishmania donovani TaxID=5661 RepID=E9BF43_LEIDO|nr:hypothetical protein, conserved [Leishmania donovani]AYU78519.1 hypothetical protein LdCL_210010600 [Leishmania donovani]CBZ33869.1 hypothetical protein, conserved [Leishmania donovani]
MLRRIAYTLLPRDPQEVRLLHHTSGGVVIAAVRYRKTSSPLFFTVVEMAAPNEQALPLRVVHVRVPRPAAVVSAVALVRSADGADIYVIVQAAEKTDAEAAPASVTSYVYRRQIVAVDEDDDGDKSHNYAVEDDVVSSSAASAAAASTRVRYQRLPRAFASASAATWTAVAAFNPSENMLTDASSSVGAAVTPTAAFITASGGGTDIQLQLWQLCGTRVALEATWRVPALAGFAVKEILTLPGTQDVVLLRHHNSILEVNLSALRSACAYRSTVTGNAFLSRAWRWLAHEQLTACAVKDALLYAGTEGGAVLVWDLRRPTSTAAAAGPCGGPPPLCSAELKTPITGLYAPYATGFITCDASGGVRDWRERGEMDMGDNQNEEAEEGALRDVAGMAASAAAAATQFPYRSRAPVEMPTGDEGCVALDGHDNFAAVVSECGRLCLYFCD